ncbi:hypothetical protein BJX99DRAFT_232695 [Aspergillus californicus]
MLVLLSHTMNSPSGLLLFLSFHNPPHLFLDIRCMTCAFTGTTGREFDRQFSAAWFGEPPQPYEETRLELAY